MAYRRKRAATRRKSSYRGRSSYSTYGRKRRTSTRRRSTRAPQTIKLVIEQAAPSVASPPGIIAARQVEPQKARF